MAAKWEVQSTTTNKVATTTAIYKNDDGKTLATVKGLKGGLKVNTDGTINGIEVTEGASGGTGTIGLHSGVLTTANVSLTLSNGGKYEFKLVGTVPTVNPTVTIISASKGTLSLVGNLSEGYKLKDAKNITYAGPKTDVTLAEVKGLDADLAMGTGDNEGKIGVNKTDDSSETPVTTFTEAITIADGVITLKANALKAGNATLTLKNGADYTLAFDSNVKAPEIGDGTWSYVNRGASTYTVAVSTAGYTLSADGKTVTYTADGDDIALVTVSGLKSNEGLSFKQNNNEDVVDAKNNRTIVLPAAALNQTTVKITKGAGFLLALDDDVAKSNVSEKDTWKVSGTTATYKHVKPEYYTYDATANQVIYTKEAELKTLATLKGLKSGLTAGDTINGIEVNSTTNIITLSGGADDTGANVSEDGALGTTNVTLTNGTGSTYKLALDTVTTPETSDEEWAVSGTTATLKGHTTAGYAKTNDTTITYVKPSATKLVTLATVKGLAKGVALKDKDTKDAVGINAKDAQGNTYFTPGLTENEGQILISANVLGTTNATVTPTAGFAYSFVLDDGSDEKTNKDTTGSYKGGKVPTEGDERHFWYNKGKSLLLREGTARYYKLEDDKTTITEIDEAVTTTGTTITGLKTDLKIVDGAIDGIDVNGKKITLNSKEIFNKSNVTLTGNTGGYSLAVNKDLKRNPNGKMWLVDGTTATLANCTSEGYELESGTVKYYSLVTGTNIATITGLKKGLKVNDDYTINGIKIGTSDTDDEGNPTFNESNSGTEIQLSKSVLGTTDVALDSTGISKGYSLAVGTDVTPITVKRSWRVGEGRNVGTAYYDVATTSAGFEEIEDNNNNVIQLAYKKKGTVTTTITGLKDNIEAINDTITGITDPDDNGVITLSQSVLDEENATLKNASGGTYTLKLNSVTAPVANDIKWVPDSKTNTKATLQGKVGTAGWQLSSDKLSVFYTPQSAGTERDILATVTGLKGGLTASQLQDGIEITGSVLKLKDSVLGGTNLKVSGGAYTLAIANAESTVSKKDEVGWVTNGTTATYKKYNTGYYTPDAKGTTVKYTKPTAGTTYATVKGVAKDADLSSIGASTTVTLTKAMLGTSNVTITGTGYKLALADGVPTTAQNAEEWVTNGTTATFKNYDKGYYTKSGNTTIKYTKPTAGTTYATIKGIKSGATITDSNGVITLSADQLAEKKVTLTGSGYSLKLDESTIKTSEGNLATSGKTWWEQAKNATSATYKQAVSKGYRLVNANTITYSKSETVDTLATVSGIAKNTTGALVTTKTGVVGAVSAIGDLSADDNSKTITVTGSDFNSNKNGAKVTIKSNEYSLGLGNLTASANDGNPEWTINKNKRTATYTQDYTEGYTLSDDANTITYSTAGTKTLATISGLDKNKLNNLKDAEDTDINWESNLYSPNDEEELAEVFGIQVNDNERIIKLLNDNVLGTGKVTLGKNDVYSFDVSEIEPGKGSDKWAVKGTTATYSKTTSDGYTTSDPKVVTYVKEVVGDPIVTITGLKKGLGVSQDGQKVGVLNRDKTIDDSNVGINLYPSQIGLTGVALGTTDINLINGEGYSYTFFNAGGNAPTSNDQWSYSGTTATYKNIQTAGYTLESTGSDAGKKITYTPAKTTTLATVKGLIKNFTDDLDDALKVTTNGDTITVSKDIITTGNVTLTVPKNGTPYSLAIGDGINKDTDEGRNTTTGWVTNGTSATYKEYVKAYYTTDATNSKIIYNKPKDITVYATIKGIKSGVDITSVAAVSDGTVGGTITLTKDMLGTSNVTVTVPKANSNAKFTLALDENVSKSEQKGVTEWVTTGTTAVYKKYDKGYYTYNSDKNSIIYTKGTNAKGTVEEYATIKGVTGDISATLGSGAKDGYFVLTNNALSNKLTIGSTLEDPTDTTSKETKYGFYFNNTYNNSAIVGSANDDSIIAEGDKLTITGGKGDDKITLSTEEDCVGNLIVYAKGDGNDTIANFREDDALKIGGFKAEYYDGDATITIPVNASTDATIKLEFIAGQEPEQININGTLYDTKYKPEPVTENVLLADNNYSMEAANLSSLVQADISSYTPYDFDGGFGLTKEDKLTPQISYSGNDK